MAFTTLQTIPNTSVKVRFKEIYASEGINKKNIVVLPRGPYRGFGLETSGVPLNLTIKSDAVASDHVAIYETADGYSLTIRDVSGDFLVDLTALATETVVIAIFADYTIGVDTSAEYRAYTQADYDAAAEKDELVVLGTVAVPASGVIPPASITYSQRTLVWENRSIGSLPWVPVIKNSGFELGETGASYLHASPYWEAAATGTNALIGPIDTDSNSGDKCLRLAADASAVTAQVKQYLQIPISTSQKVKIRFAKKVLIAASGGTGTATVTLDFADKDGVSLSNVVSGFDIESVDGAWQESEGVVEVPAGVRVFNSVTVDVAGTYGSSGDLLLLDDIQVWLEPVGAMDGSPVDQMVSGEVAAHALLIGDENSHDGNSVLVKYAANTLDFTRRDGDTVPASQYGTNFPGDLSAGNDFSCSGFSVVGGDATLSGDASVGGALDATGLTTTRAGVLAKDPGGNNRVVVDSNGLPTGRIGVIRQNWEIASLPEGWQNGFVLGGATALFDVDVSQMGAPAVRLRTTANIQAYTIESVHPYMHPLPTRLWVMEGELWGSSVSNSAAQWGGLNFASAGAYFSFSSSSSPNWQTVTGQDVGPTYTTQVTSVPVAANTVYRMRIEWYGSSMPGGSRVLFYIDGVLVSTHTTNLPDVAIRTMFKNNGSSIVVTRDWWFGPFTVYYNRVLSDDVI